MNAGKRQKSLYLFFLFQNTKKAEQYRNPKIRSVLICYGQFDVENIMSLHNMFFQFIKLREWDLV